MRLVYQQSVPADVDNGNFRSCFGNPLQNRTASRLRAGSCGDRGGGRAP